MRFAEFAVFLQLEDAKLLQREFFWAATYFKLLEEADGCFFVVASGGLDGRAMEFHLEELGERARAPIDFLIENGIPVEGCYLRIVAYIGEGDRVGPGIPIDEDWVSVVAKFNGYIDIDLYVVGTG